MVCLAAAAGLRSDGHAQGAPAVPGAAVQPAAATPQRALVNQYCVGCHNDKVKTAGLSLADFDRMPPVSTPRSRRR
jgi:cytochrome c551/c552